MRILPPSRLLLLLACCVGLVSCATQTVGTPYREVIARVESALESQVDDGIFPYTKDQQNEQTVFRFIEGSRREKVDHAFPLRITVTISPEDGESDSSFAVEAHKHGLKMKRRGREAELRWRSDLEQAITEN